MVQTKRIAELAGDKQHGDTARTFVIENHGHTLGNALRCIIIGYPDVDFCGYSVPHPAEAKIHFRIQTKGTKAIDVLERGLIDLERVCDAVETKFRHEMEEFKSTGSSSIVGN